MIKTTADPLFPLGNLVATNGCVSPGRQLHAIPVSTPTWLLGRCWPRGLARERSECQKKAFASCLPTMSQPAMAKKNEFGLSRNRIGR